MHKAIRTAQTPQLRPRKLYVAMLAATQFLLAGQAFASPEGGEVVGGSGSITQAGKETVIHQQTERMAIDWQSFDVKADERVQFVQPSVSSLALNRVLSHSGSKILGRIDANGQVLLVNPNGVVFGKGSEINVGGMLASGLSVDSSEFMKGALSLSALEGTSGLVENAGTINAATGGSVTLLGKEVMNQGLIVAELGAVTLAAGKAAVVSFDGSGMLGVKVTQAQLQNELGVDAAVINSGEIEAKGGRIVLSATTSQDIFSQAVNHMTMATSAVVNADGSFTLGAGANVSNSGKLNVSAASGNAGEVLAIGEKVSNSGQITANASLGEAGHIELNARDTTELTQHASLSAQGNTTGGDIKVLGNKVGVFDQASINASGTNGGGQILIGGDKTGANKAINNASFIYLGEETQAHADALLYGTGGKLITFAADTARIYGNLTALGGSESGNGGFIETSGLKGFDILNAPNVGAVNGVGGEWLIDPWDITISGSQDQQRGAAPSFAPASGSSSLGTGILLQALANNATVTVTTGGDSNSGNGNITLEGAIQYNLTGSKTLKLNAANNIYIQNNIERVGGTGSLSVELNAYNGTNKTGTGSIFINPGRKIETNGGSFIASGKDFTSAYDANDNNKVSWNDAINTSIANSTSQGGTVTLDMTGDVKLKAPIRTGGGDFVVGNTSIDASTKAVTINKRAASFNSSFDNLNTTPGMIDTSNVYGGGDIYINTTGQVDLGAVDFSYIDKSQTNNNINNLKRVGSLQINSTSGAVNLKKDIDFNLTGMRTNNGTLPNAQNFVGQDTSIKVNTAGNITVSGSIYDTEGTSKRDALNIELISSAGNVEIKNNIYTGGGNFSASGTSFTSGIDGANAFKYLIDTDNANGNASLSSAEFTNGGNVTISANGAVNLGSIITDTTSPATGNLIIKGVAAGNNVTVNQASGSSLSIAGTSTFNLGSDLTNSDLSLLNTTNKFAGTVSFTSAGGVSFYNSDTTDTNIGASVIAGSFTLTSLGNITQSGAITVGTSAAPKTTTITATGKSVTLGNTGNDFSSFKFGSDFASLTLNDTNALSVTSDNKKIAGLVQITAGSALTTTDAISTNSTTADAGAIQLQGTSINLGGDVTANTTKSGSKGGAITFSGAVVLNNNVQVSTTGTTAGDITFNNTIESVANGAKNLTLTGKDIYLKNDVGANDNTRLGTFTLTATGAINATDGAQTPVAKDIFATVFDVTKATNFTAGIINTSNGKQDVKATGTVKINSMDSSSANGAITVTGSDITLAATGTAMNSGTGKVTVTAGDSTATAPKITLNGNVISTNSTNAEFKLVGATTANGIIDFSGLATLFSSPITVTGNSVTQKTGKDTFIAPSTSNTWDLTAGTVIQKVGNNTKTITYTNIENLTGGAAVDTFTINAAPKGIINGGAGADIFNISVSLTNAIYGGADSDSFNIENSGVNVTNLYGGISGETANTVQDEDTLAGSDNGNTWTLKSTGAGELANTGDTTNKVSYSGIETLIGGNLVDKFVVDSTINASITQTITGNGTADTLQGYASAENTWSSLTGTSGQLTSKIDTSNKAITFSGISVLNGGGSKDTFTTTSNFSGAINGNAGADIFNIGHNVTGSISGGAGADTFNLLAKNISVANIYGNDAANTAEAGITDTLSASAKISTSLDENNTWTLSDAGKGTVQVGASGSTSFTGIESIVSGTGTDFLTGANTATTWTLSATGVGNLTKTDNNSAIISYSGIETLIGGNLVDKFVVDSTINASITQTITGNGTADTLQGYASAENTWSSLSDTSGQLTSKIDTSNKAITFSGISVLNGGSGKDTFTTTGNFSGAINGNAGADIFNIGHNVTGSISGGAGADTFNLLAKNISVANIYGNDAANTAEAGITDTLSASAKISTSLDENNTWILSDAGKGTVQIGASGSTSFTGIESIVSGTGADSLTGANTATTWTLSATGVGNLTKTDNNSAIISYSGIETLIGGSLVDKFVVSAAGITQTIDGGNNTQATDLDTLTGADVANTWASLSGDGGTLNRSTAASSTDGISFSKIEQLNGGSNQDTFTFITAFTGSVNGGEGDDTFDFTDTNSSITGSLDGGADGVDRLLGHTSDSEVNWESGKTDAGSLVITSTGNTYVASFSNIETVETNNTQAGTVLTIKEGLTSYVGQGNNATLSNGLSGDATWVIGLLDGNNNYTATNAGTFKLNSFTANFTNFANLIGGSGNDTFDFRTNQNQVQGAHITGTISGGGGTQNNIIAPNTAANTWALMGANSGTLKNANGDLLKSFSAIQVLTGGGGDSLTGRNQANTWTIASAGNTLKSSDNSVSDSITFSGMSALIGLGAVDSFTFDKAFTGTVNAGGGADSFTINTAVGSLYGEGDDDKFTLNSNGSATLIDGGAGTNNSLTSKINSGAWALTDANEGTLKNTDGTSTYASFTGIQSITGNGSDSLTGRNQANTWTIATAGNTLKSSDNSVSDTMTFSGMNKLIGSDAVDTFIFNTVFAGTVNAGKGADSFTINAAVGSLYGEDDDDSFTLNPNGSATLIDGGAGANNSLTSTIASGAWALSDANKGTLKNTNGTSTYAGFQAIQTITGSGTDSLTGRNQTNTWTISAAGNTLKSSDNSVSDTMTFSGMNKLIGSDAIDTFIFNTVFAGTVNAGKGADSFTIKAAVGSLYGEDDDDSFTLNTNGSATSIDGGAGTNNSLTSGIAAGAWALSGANQGTVKNQAGTSTYAGFQAIQTITGSGTDSLTGRNQVNTWNITGANAGTVGEISFSQFSSLIGGNNTDDFNLQTGGSFIGTLNGGTGGIDTLSNKTGSNLSWVLDTTNLNTGKVTDSALTNNISFAAIDALVGNNNESLTGHNLANIWNITGANKGTVGEISFTQFSSLIGGTNTDDFNLQTGGSFIGTLNGGAGGTDTLSNKTSSNLSWVLDATSLNTGKVTDSALTNNISFAAMDALVGNNNESLTGHNIANIWNITGANKGNVGEISFSQFKTLVGGSDKDDFNLQTSGSFIGTFNGGASGTDTLSNKTSSNLNWVLDASVLNAGKVTDSALTNNISFAAIDVLVGNTNESLTGHNLANTWDITGANKGTVGEISFSQFSSLIGGNNTDDFNLQSGGSFIGTLSGGIGGTDTLSNKTSSNLSWVLDASVLNAGKVTDSALTNNISFAAIDALVGNSSEILTGHNLANTWNITGANAGKVGEISFSQFSSLIGGNNTDDFNLQTGGSFIGTLNGGTGGTDTLSNKTSSNLSWVLDTSVLNAGKVTDSALTNNISFAAIDTLVGNNNESLTGHNLANTWNITGANKGNVGEISFSQFSSLIGGNNTDYFDFSNIASSLTGSITGGLGVNSLKAHQNVTNTWTKLSPTSGSIQQTNPLVTPAYLPSFINIDNFIYGLQDKTITNSFDLRGITKDTAPGSIAGLESGKPTYILGADLNTEWTVTGADAGTLKIHFSDTTKEISFTNIKNLYGGSLQDDFTFNSGGSISGGVYGSAYNQTVDGKLITIGQEASGTINTLKGITQASQWALSSAISGNVSLTTPDKAYATFVGIQKVIGNSTADTLIGPSSAMSETWSLGTTNKLTIDGSSLDFDGFETLQGGAGSNTLVNTNANFGWTITGAKAGEIKGNNTTVSFSNMGTLQGSGTDSLTGMNEDNTWNITGSKSGNLVNKLAGVENTLAFSGMNALKGGDKADSFTYAGGLVSSIDGGAGDNTLTAANSTNVWELMWDSASSYFTGSLNKNTATAASFSNIQHLNGSGEDSLTGPNVDSLWRLNSDASGALEANNKTIAFTALKTINGGSATDTLAASNSGNTWTITGDNKGTLAWDTKSITFNSIENLTGGSAIDKFTFNANTSLTGLINGQEGADTLDVSAISNANVELANLTAGRIHVINVETITAATTGTNSFYGASDSGLEYVWDITAENKGTISSGPAMASPVIITAFENFNQLFGGTQKDTFNVGNVGAITGSISGGGSVIDWLSYEKKSGAVNIALGSTGKSGFTGVTDIEGIIGSDNSKYTSTINVENEPSYNTWAIGKLEGSDGLNDITLTGTGKPDVYLKDFNNIQASTAADTFTLQQGGQFIGVINGNGGGDTFNATAAGKQLIKIANVKSANAISLQNVQNIKVAADSDSTLVAADTANDWLINTATGGTLNTNIVFTGFANLTGGNLVDKFIVSDYSSLKGVLDGGLGVNTLDATGLGGAFSVALENNADANVRATNISQIDANNNNSNTLLGYAGAKNDWTITSANGGTLNNVGFTGFANLTGGAAVDTFSFKSPLASLSGLINGGGNAASAPAEDVLDITAAGRDMSIHFSFSSAFDHAADISAYNIENVKAVTQYKNTLTAADNSDATWTLNGANAGSVSNGSASLLFSGIASLNAAAGNDTFMFEKAFAGTIDGGAQTTADIADFSKLENYQLILSNFPSIEEFIGKGGDGSSIKGLNANGQWNITDTTKTVTYETQVITFSGFANLIGGDAGNTFNLSGGELTGSVTGGSDVDIFRLTGTSVGGDLSGGAANDSFLISAGRVAGKIDGGAGDDAFTVTIKPTDLAILTIVGGGDKDTLTLDGNSTAAAHSNASKGAGVLTYQDALPATGLTTVKYQDITSIVDQVTANSLSIAALAGDDQLTLMNKAYSLNGYTKIDYDNKSNLIINASPKTQVNVQGELSLNDGALTVNGGVLATATSADLIKAHELILNSNTAVGSNKESPLNTRVDSLSLMATQGHVFIANQGDLILDQFDPSASVDLKASGAVTSTHSLKTDLNEILSITAKSINLTGNNSLIELLNLNASGDVYLENNADTKLGLVSANNLTINSAGSIHGTEKLDVTSTATLKAGDSQDISLTNTANTIKTLSVLGAANVTLNNANELTLSDISKVSGLVSTQSQGINLNGAIAAGSLQINAGDGAAKISSNVDLSDALTVTAKGIQLDDGKQLTAGDVTLTSVAANMNLSGNIKATNKVLLNGSASSNFVLSGNIESGTSTVVNTTGSVTQRGSISGGLLQLTANSVVTDTTAKTNVAGAVYDITNALTLNDLSSSKFITATAGTLTVNGAWTAASGDINLKATTTKLAMNTDASLTASLGAVNLGAGTSLDLQAISAAKDINLSAIDRVDVNSAITSKAGAITLTTTGAQSNVTMGSHSQLNVDLGSVNVNATGNFIMDSGAVINTPAGGVKITGNDLRVSSINAMLGVEDITSTLGLVDLHATGLISGMNDASKKIVASELKAVAVNGVGNNVAEGRGDVLYTQVQRLDVANTSGTISIDNSSPVSIFALHTDGRIDFHNDGGVILDNRRTSTAFSQADANTSTSLGIINAGYKEGVISFYTNNGGLLRASGQSPDRNHPDIIAQSADMRIEGGQFGNISQRLVVYVQDNFAYESNVRTWNPIWGYGVRPKGSVTKGGASIPVSDLLSAGAEQMVVVESLNEVNQAVFTGVKNYNYDDIAILLPPDQRYDDDETKAAAN